MNYNQLSKEAHQNAVEHGFWDKFQNHEHFLALIFSEVGEAIEADRKDRKSGVFYCPTDPAMFNSTFEQVVKDSLEDEFADIMIRLFDLAGGLMIDFDRLPECNYYRAFERFSFTENAYAFIKGMSKERIGIEKRVLFGLEFIENWAEHLRIPLGLHVSLKMRYNKSREHLHAKAY